MKREEADVVGHINANITDLNAKMEITDSEQAKIPPLQTRLDELLSERSELELVLEELITSKEQRDRDDEDMENEYQNNLSSYNKRMDQMNKEMKKIKGQIAETESATLNIKALIGGLKTETEVMAEKIMIKRELMRKRKKDDEREEEYVPVPNDPIDIKMANYRNKKETLVPIKRIEHAKYMFGTMRIDIELDGKQPSNYAVRVLKTKKRYDLDHFIKVEGNKELDKLIAIQEDQHMIVDESENTELRKSPGRRRSPGSRSPNESSGKYRYN